MGMSASQGRLLALTSLRSDAELQAQKINNDREALARQEEVLMTKYTDAMNNKKLSFKGDESTDYVYLTAENLAKAGYVFIIGDKAYGDRSKVKNVDGKKVYDYSGLGDQYNAKGGEDINALQWGLINGTIKLYKEEEVDEEKKWQEINYAGDAHILEEYDESDDARAKAEYDSELKKVQRKDKKLELQLDQIETKHKAYETEIESVQKIINSNIESSFNTFNKG